MHDGIWEAITSAPDDDINAGNIRRSGVKEGTIKKAVTALQNQGRVDQYMKNGSGPRKWLGVVGGRLYQEEREAVG